MSTTLVSEATLRTLLTEHWLAAMNCDEVQQCDRAACACSRVDLGWQPTVGAAVATWIDHLVSQPAPEASAITVIRQTIRTLIMLADTSEKVEPDVLRYLSSRLTAKLRTIERGT